MGSNSLKVNVGRYILEACAIDEILTISVSHDSSHEVEDLSVGRSEDGGVVVKIACHDQELRSRINVAFDQGDNSELSENALCDYGSVEYLNSVREDVRMSYEEEEMLSFATFESFFNDVDVMNSYEEGWEDLKCHMKAHYEKVWEEFKEGKLSFD